MAFADEIESIFTTKGLEKNPTAELELFVPPPQTRPVEFSEEEEVKVDTALHRVADRVRGLCMCEWGKRMGIGEWFYYICMLRISYVRYYVFQ